MAFLGLPIRRLRTARLPKWYTMDTCGRPVQNTGGQLQIFSFFRNFFLISRTSANEPEAQGRTTLDFWGRFSQATVYYLVQRYTTGFPEDVVLSITFTDKHGHDLGTSKFLASLSNASQLPT